MSERSSRWYLSIEVVVFVLIMLLGLALRTAEINRGFWEDEAFEYTMSAARPFWGALTFQPFPLYHVFSYLALFLADEEWVLRLPSVIAGMGCIAAVYFIARAYAGRILAAVAALMLATSSFHVVSSTDARFYALVMLVVVFMVYALDRALRLGRKRDWCLFVVAGNIGGLSQATVLPFLAGMAIGATLWLLKKHWGDGALVFLRKTALLTACVMLSLVGIVFCSAIGEYGLFRSLDSDPEAVMKVTDGVVPQYEIKTYKLSSNRYMKYFGVYFENLSEFLGWGLVVVALFGIRYLWRFRPELAYVLVASILVTPIPLLFLETTHWYHARYFCPLIPISILLIVAGLAQLVELATSYLQKRSAVEFANRFAPLVRGLIAVCFVLLFTPRTVENLQNVYAHPYGRGLHGVSEYKLATQYIRDIAGRRDVADVAVPRPDWHYYHRKVLASYLNEPAVRGETFNIWYMFTNPMRKYIDDLPGSARLIESIHEDWMGEYFLHHFQLTPGHLRLIPELGQYSTLAKSSGAELRCDNTIDPETFTMPATLTLSADGATYTLSSERTRVMPHRYVEFLATLNGPPQFGLLMKFYDEDGVLLHTESRWMRETGASNIYAISGIYGEDERVVAQREPHPTGAAPPMSGVDGDFTLKLSAVTPPCTAFMETQIQVRGDTRAGDTYLFQSSMAQGDWEANEQFQEIVLPPIGVPNTAESDWFMKGNGTAAWINYPATEGTPEEIQFYFRSDNPSFDFFSSPIDIEESSIVQLELEFRGNIDAFRLYVKFYDIEGRNGTMRELVEPLYILDQRTRPNMFVVKGVDGWSKLRATIPAQQGDRYIVIHLNPDRRETHPMKKQGLRIRSPKLFGNIFATEDAGI